MNRPVEIHRKKAALLWVAAIGFSWAAYSVWQNYDNFLPLLWKGVFIASGLLFTASAGLIAFVKLLSDAIRKEPYLLIYDDSIEIRHWLKNKFWLLHFCDVEDIVRVGDLHKFEIVFRLQPFLKKSDQPRRWSISFKKNVKNTFKLPLSSLSMPDKEIYDLILDRYLKYREKRNDLILK